MIKKANYFANEMASLIKEVAGLVNEMTSLAKEVTFFVNEMTSLQKEPHPLAIDAYLLRYYGNRQDDDKCRLRNWAVLLVWKRFFTFTG